MLEPRDFHMLVKCSTTDTHAQHNVYCFQMLFKWSKTYVCDLWAYIVNFLYLSMPLITGIVYIITFWLAIWAYLKNIFIQWCNFRRFYFSEFTIINIWREWKIRFGKCMNRYLRNYNQNRNWWVTGICMSLFSIIKNIYVQFLLKYV